MNKFILNMLAAEEPIYQGECISLVVPMSDGLYGIQANHSNMIAAIVPGKVKFIKPGGEKVVAEVSEGMVKVEDNHVMLLLDTIDVSENK